MFFLKIINVPEKIRKRKAREANPARICLVPLRENRNHEVWHFAAGRGRGIVRAGAFWPTEVYRRVSFAGVCAGMPFPTKILKSAKCAGKLHFQLVR